MAFFEVAALCKSYETPSLTIPVLDQLELSMDRGEFLSIIGESGSGKSTLLQILGTLDEADSGTATLDGSSLFGLSSSERARLRNRKLGFVYQAHHLIPELSAIENIMLPLMIRGENRVDAKTRSDALLARMHLSERAEHVPARLSGGEAQRVAVARALVGSPHLLLADEPTGNLDENTADDVFQALLQLCHEENAAVVMVTHSTLLASATDRTLRLQHGKLNPLSA